MHLHYDNYLRWTLKGAEIMCSTECSLNIVFFSQRILSFVSTGLPLAVRKWSTNKSDGLQGMGCRELGKNTIFNEHPVLYTYYSTVMCIKGC